MLFVFITQQQSLSIDGKIRELMPLYSYDSPYDKVHSNAMYGRMKKDEIIFRVYVKINVG